MGLLRQQRKRPPIAHPEGAEVPVVQGNDDVRPQLFGEDRNGSVCATEGEVAVALNQVGDERPVVAGGRVHLDISVSQTAEKCCLDAAI